VGGDLFVQRAKGFALEPILAAVALVPEEGERCAEGQEHGEEDGEGEGFHEEAVTS
jgi:hypothetical protein